MTAAIAAVARKTLLERRAQVGRLKSHNEADGQSLGLEAPREIASNKELAGVLLSLSDRERHEVLEIDAALARIEAGVWGQCESCHERIAAARLAAVPEARRCVSCAA